MVTAESIQSIDKNNLEDVSKTLSSEDISQLVEWLSLKDDTTRYPAFLLLQSRSRLFDDVYPYWDTFQGKLKRNNSYQRSIGLMLIAENVKWDSESRMETAIDDYLDLLNDEKPITVRQCIQSFGKIVPYKPGLIKKITGELIAINLMAIKETMRKSILLDILNILLIIRKNHNTDEIEAYIINALTGEILDNKTKKQIEEAMNKA